MSISLRNNVCPLSHQAYESVQSNVSSYFTIDFPKEKPSEQTPILEKISTYWQNGWKTYKVIFIRSIPFSLYYEYSLCTEKYTKFLPSFVKTSFFYPLCEELIFRGILYNFFKKTFKYLGAKEKNSKYIANVVQAIIFGFGHYLKDGHRFVHIGTSFAGFFYGLSDSWETSTVAHSLWNMTSWTIVNLFIGTRLYLHGKSPFIPLRFY